VHISRLDTILRADHYGNKLAPIAKLCSILHVDHYRKKLAPSASLFATLCGRRDVRNIVDIVRTDELRRNVFIVEGWARLYSPIAREANVIEEMFRELEDLLGAVAATQSNLNFAINEKAPPKVINILREEHDRKCQELLALLASRFAPDSEGRIPRVARAVTMLRETHFDDYDADREAVKNELVRSLEKIAATRYDMNELQSGIHELRRNLRWFPIFMESLDGLIEVDEIDNTEHDGRAPDTSAPKPLQVLTRPNAAREAHTFRVPQDLHAKLMQIQIDLGKLKDVGEPMERLMQAYRTADIKDPRASVVMLVGGESKMEEIHARAEEVYQDMRQSRLIERIADAFR
jgi:hypothetical protein